MKSDVIVVQFIDKLGYFKSEKIQKYLDGENQWNLPILEKDIIKIDYTFNAAYSERNNHKIFTSGILLVHRVPKNKPKEIINPSMSPV